MEHKSAVSELTITELSNGHKFINIIIRSSWIAYFFSALFQVVFYPELTNLVTVVFVGIGWFAYVKIFMRNQLWRSFTFSSFIIFGFATTHILLPLLFTTIEGKAITNNLEYSELVFLHSLAALAVLTVSHAIYRTLTVREPRRSFSIMESTGFFTPPNDLQLWLMGLIGLASIYYVYFASPDVGRSVTGTTSDKLVQALSTFTYAPYLILCGALYDRKSSKLGVSVLFPLAVFTIGLFAISIGRNSTGAFMFGFTGTLFAYFVGAVLGVFKAKIFTTRNFIFACLGIWFLVGPLADLRTAMVIVRGERTEIPAETLVERTLEAYGDKEAIKERRDYDNDDQVQDPDWDERYLDNVFLARFANMKFNDLSLSRAELLGEYDPNMLEFALQYFIGGLPDPVIKFFNFDIEKDFVYSISTGDYLYFTSGGTGPLEVYRVGHFAGIGMATFGWWYLGILGVVMIPIFYLCDRFQKRELRNEEDTDDAPRTNRLKFSFCGLLAITSFYQFLQVESVTQLGIFIMRGWLQTAVLYLIIFHVTRILSGSGMKRLKWNTATT
jgi:hypothetical protein